jgi:hypothetical protein
MKKQLAKTIVLLASSIYLHADDIADDVSLDYEGSKDDTYWTGTDHYEGVVMRTTLGLLARYSDVIGIGQVSGLTNNEYRENNCFTVTVDYALIGCTNGASFVVYETPFMPMRAGKGDIDAYMPTNGNRIVFAVSTNIYPMRKVILDTPEIPWPPDRIRDKYVLNYLNRSWWPVDRDDGVLFTQFTNVIQAARFDRNWTNYFELCRDGATSTSNRVKEDSYWDMRRISMYASDDEAQFILDDPLVHEDHKTCINAPGWRYTGPLW